MQNRLHRLFFPLSAALFIFAVMIAEPCGAQRDPLPDGTKLLRRLPLAFESNEGQTDPSFRFVFHSNGLSARFEPNAAEFTVPSVNLRPQPIRLEFLHGAPNTTIASENPLPGKVNYLRGADPSRWNRDVSTFGQIRYQSLYPGVDLVFYGNGEHVEHDFVIAPRSDPSSISVEVQTDGKLQLASDGDLLIETAGSVLRFRKPVAYQTTPGGKIDVPAKFHLTGNTFSFDLGAFDPSLPLVIDPILTYSTFLAGSQADSVAGIAVDASGNAYLTGWTLSSDFPTKAPYQATCSGSCADIFVTKLDPTGTALVYSTFIGGTNGDYATGIAIDSQGNAVVAGYTGSADFPTKNSYTTFMGFTTTYAFVLALSPDGTALNYSSLLGQILLSGSTTIGVAADNNGSAYVTGQTYDVNFPITPGTVGSSIPGYPYESMFVTKLSSNGALQYSTVIPGMLPQNPYTFNGNDFAPTSIGLDQARAVYIGGTAGPGLPTTPGSLSMPFPGDPTNSSDFGGFALKLSPDASTIAYATYLPSTTSVTAIAPADLGTLYVAGQTYSASFAATSGALQTQCPPGQYTQCAAGFVAKLDATASKFLAATYLAGTPAPSNAGTNIQSIALESGGNLWVGGITGSADFQLKNPIVTIFPQDQDGGFISELSGDLTSLLFSTFLNGQLNVFNHTVQLYVASGGPGVVLAAGTTGDSDFPTTIASFQPAVPNPQMFGPNHGFVTKIDTTVAAAAACLSAPTLNFGSWLVNTPSPVQILTVQNCGNATLHVQTPAISNPDFSQVNTCSAPVTPGSTCQISVTFTPSSLNFETATLTITDDAPISTQTISLSGQGGQPQVSLPPQLTFGDLLVGTSATSTGAFLFNAGNGNLIVSNVTITGDFSFQNFCTTPVAPNNYCFISLTFSPTAAGARTGLLTITDNVSGSPQLIQLAGNGLTAYPIPSISAIQAVPVSTTGGTLQIVGNYFFPASVVLWHGSPRPISYIDENDIAATLTPEDLAQIGEFDVRVVNPSPGGGSSALTRATVYLSIPQSTGELVYDKHAQRLYASVPASAATNANSLIVMDPQTGDVLKTIPIGSNPKRVALSDDGKYLYVGLDQTGQVVRLSTHTWDVQETIQLPFIFFFGQTIAQDITVIPGEPESVVVSLAFSSVSPQSAGVIVYDGVTPRPTSIPDWITFPDVAANSIAFLGSTTSILYGSDLEVGTNFYRFNLNTNGVSLQDATSTFGAGILATDGTLFYESNGNIIDPKIPSVVRTYVPSDGGTWSAVEPDLNRERIYASETGFSPYYLFFIQTLFTKADLKTLSPLESIIFPSPYNESVQDIVPWGKKGIALRLGTPSYLSQRPNQGDAIILFEDGLVRPGDVDIDTSDPDVSVDRITGNYLITLTLRNGGDLEATNVQVTEASLAAVSGGAPVGTLTNLPLTTTLAPGATSHITLSFPVSVAAAGSKVVLTLSDEPFSFILPGGSIASEMWSASVHFTLPHNR